MDSIKIMSTLNKKYFNWFKDEQINMYIDYKPKNLSELKKNVKELIY